MLRGSQLEGMSELLDCVRGCEESDNSVRRERMKRFAAAAIESGLTSRQKELMTLLYTEGLSQKQAGEVLNMSQSAVSNMRRRALERMKSLAKYMI